MPSRYEPFGLVFLEAMHRGLACVGTNHCAMPEIIVDGETGRLVPGGDIDALTDVLMTMAEDPEATAAMGRAALERAQKHFTWAGCVTDMSAAVELL
jgi:glycosyltransferase involved in cell wall biosynthesis